MIHIYPFLSILVRWGLMYLLSLMNIHLNYFAALCVLVVVFTVAYKYFLSAR